MKAILRKLKIWITAINLRKETIKLLYSDSRKGFLVHFLLVGFLSVVILLAFFKLYLPSTTNFGETVTVPDFTGMDIGSAFVSVQQRDLTCEVIDSVYSNDFLPGHIISQFPLPHSRVKVSRKIHFVVNAKVGSTAQIPNIIGSSLRNAQQQLISFGFKIGEISYVPHAISNKIISVSISDKVLSESELEKGFIGDRNQPINLIVADGIGEINMKMPSLVGRPLDEAEIILLASNLRIRKIHWLASQKIYGTVLDQKPIENTVVRVNQSVDIWVASEK